MSAHGHASSEGRSHTVQFFHPRAYPADRIAEYLGEALARGRAAVVIAATDHRDAIVSALRERGADVTRAIEREQLVLLDADELARTLGDADPSEASSFEAVLTAPVTRAAARFEGARVYGELADVLAARDGGMHRALALERAWDAFLEGASVELLCGYSYERFASAASDAELAEVCAAHAHGDANEGAEPRGPIGARLEQAETAVPSAAPRRAGLESERMLLERERTERARAEIASRHLARLQALTSALSSALSVEDVARVVSTEIARAIDAGRAALHLTKDGEIRGALDGTVAPDDASAALDAGRSYWASGDEGAGAVSALPLIASERALGVLSWTGTTRALSEGERALLEDCAREVALALDRALSYEAARDERQRAEAASRAKDEFLAVLGHELRNPLSPMLIALELMRVRDDGALARERDVMERQVTHMVRLVDDLLDVSRIARGNVALHRVPIEVASLTADAIEIAGPALEKRAQVLTADVPGDGLRVSADRGRIVQVIVNLLINASKFSPRGARIEVGARASERSVSLSVRDRGIGIDPALLPRVFDLFVQGAQMSDRKSGGLGLGLAIAKNLIELHGGSLLGQSDGLGHGSTFTLELPRVSGEGAARPPMRKGRGGTTSALRILVVDDNHDAASVLSAILEAWGHEVGVAHDAPAALALAETLRPEIALLDIGLPVMDGHELARRLTAALDVPPKMVAVTGYGQEADHRRSRESGFCRHLVKPVAPEHLRRVLGELIEV